jgi:hypothetical protein
VPDARFRALTAHLEGQAHAQRVRELQFHGISEEFALIVESDIIGRIIEEGCGAPKAAQWIRLPYAWNQFYAAVQNICSAKQVYRLTGEACVPVHVVNVDREEIMSRDSVYFVRECTNIVYASPLQGIHPPVSNSSQEGSGNILVWIKLVFSEESPVYFGSLQVEQQATVSDVSLYLSTILQNAFPNIKIYVNSLQNPILILNEEQNAIHLNNGDQILIKILDSEDCLES